jgi:Type II secretion system (T2SS), protein G
MKRLIVRAALVFGAGLVCLSVLSVCAWAKGELSAKEARNLIRRIGGGELPSGAIRIKAITPSGASEALVLAQIETAFRFESDDNDRWRVAEIRTGRERWEDLSLIAQAAAVTDAPASSSSETGATEAGERTSVMDARHAREIIARLVGIRLPSDAVRVKEVSALYKSAVVVAEVTAEFRFGRGSDNRWRVAQLRTGDGEWKDIERILHAVNTEKARRARAELEMLAAALASFRRERGFYVVAETTGALVDQLNPRYLARVIRLDPWHQPYLYEGERDRFVLRSSGADAMPGTGDDISVGNHP